MDEKHSNGTSDDLPDKTNSVRTTVYESISPDMIKEALIDAGTSISVI